MTNEEHIKKLKDILSEATETEDAVCYVTSEDKETLEAAISALSQPQPDIEDIVTQYCKANDYILVAKDVWQDMKSQPDIEAIRQDIKDIMPQYADGTGWDEGRRFALKEVLRIIDKHIQKGKEQE